MPRPRRFSAEQLEELRRLRARGVPLATIAEKYSAPVSSVATAIRHGYRNMAVPTLPRSHRGRPRRFPEAMVKLIADRRAEGYSLKEIAADLSAPVTTVQRASKGYVRDPRYQPRTCAACHQALV